ncbi:DUF418 domain-containing protein [Arenimonas sp.]|uniref:DUF418 domain-containing protein n=1 Tax=Arenimonas sp. TaxID=1872635 RepID=UPI0039E46C97
MSDSQATAITGELLPVQAAERIHALDIVRGFALIGIFLMNVEWFSRPITELGTGVNASLTGMDYVASWFIYTFVQGKFWTMFSLLFGMGFAVMLGRAETTERSFVAPYIRRIIGLFLFGSAHFVFVWTGDILHNYAVTAIFLLLISTNSWKTAFGILLSCFITGTVVMAMGKQDWSEPFFMYGSLTMVSGLLVFRDPFYRYIAPRWKLLLGILLALVAGIVGLAVAFPEQTGGPMKAGPIAGGVVVVLVVIALLMNKLNKDAIARYWKWGVLLYSLPFFLGLVGLGIQSAKQHFAPPQEQSAAATPADPAKAKAEAEKKAEEAKQKAENEKRQAERKAERAKETAEEIRLYTKGSYWESVVHRAKRYQEDAIFAGGLGFLALPMFLIGFWFVRSGVIGNIRENLPLFRKLSFTALPIGLAMTLTAVSLHSSFLNVDWTQNSPRVAQTLFQWGMMPLSIGYVAVLICLIYTDLGQKLLSPLRYAGQMALTNYIGACAIGMWYFSGYGLGQWGEVSRAWQIVFVFAVFAVQLLFSMWWLSKFRYGPLEWVWRAITYWQLPPLRRTA